MVILGHRGASGYAPENTLAAFRKGIEQNCDGFEIDVQLTKDNELVLFHDWSLGRSATGSGLIKDLNLDYILKQDAGSWFAEEFKGEKIPTLKEFFDFVPKGMLINVEAKAKATDERDLGNRLVEEIIACDRVEDVIVSSFNHKTLNQIKDVSKDIKIGALMYSRLIEMEDYFLTKFPVYSAHLSEELTDREMVTEIKSIGAKVYVWTVNDKGTADQFKDMGVDGIITNYPDLYSK
mgnify:CR=1 FL=1